MIDVLLRYLQRIVADDHHSLVILVHLNAQLCIINFDHLISIIIRVIVMVFGGIEQEIEMLLLGLDFPLSLESDDF